jgi:muramidase (phage lysozyme)
MATINIEKHFGAFLDLIAKSEGTSSHPLTKSNGYDVIVSGVDGLHIFTDFSTHPFALGRAPILVREAQPEQVKTLPIGSDSKPQIVAPAVPALHSTASGRYQIIWPTWKKLAAIGHFGTFAPTMQDLACINLLSERGADHLIMNGKITEAIEVCCEEWASFPGNLFKQGGHKMDWLLAEYSRLLEGQNV